MNAREKVVYFRSRVPKASTVKCQLIPMIDPESTLTLVWHVNQHLINISINYYSADTQSTLNHVLISTWLTPDWQLVDSRPSVSWLIYMYQSTLNGITKSAKISQVSPDFWLWCWSTVDKVSAIRVSTDQGNWLRYQSTLDHWCLKYTWSNISLNLLVPGSRFFC